MPERWDEEQQVSDAVTRLKALAETGMRTSVDPTVTGLGRDVPGIALVNEQVDLNILVATGLYTLANVPYGVGPGTAR